MDQELLTTLVSKYSYNPDDGLFISRKNTSGKKEGRIAGTMNPEGYIKIKINGKVYSAHRLAFLYMTGSIPKIVDHINREKADNRFGNLREANYNLNNQNKKSKGYRLLDSGIKRYSVRKRYDGVVYRKNFLTEDEAILYVEELNNLYAEENKLCKMS